MLHLTLIFFEDKKKYIYVTNLAVCMDFCVTDETTATDLTVLHAKLLLCLRCSEVEEEVYEEL